MGGAVDMRHASQHSWRDKSDKANIYVRKYLPSSDRASLSKFMNEQALMTQTEYAEKDPNRRHHLRPKDQILDKRATQRFTAHNELERIQEAING